MIDFVMSENSMGFHAPQEAMRILGDAINLCRLGQLSLHGGPPPEPQPAEHREGTTHRANCTTQFRYGVNATQKSNLVLPNKRPFFELLKGFELLIEPEFWSLNGAGW